jgi:hypothetical protein
MTLALTALAVALIAAGGWAAFGALANLFRPAAGLPRPEPTIGGAR